MSAKNKVTELHRARSRERRVTKAMAVLHHCRDHLVGALERALPAMMDRVDDALFDLADKADSNRDQTVYFEAMREVRVKRPGMESKFCRALAERINAKIQRRQSLASEPGTSEARKLKLVLVEDDDLEETLAFTNMVAKIRNTSHAELFALERRVALLLNDPDIEGHDNPLGPESICEAFREASEEIESSIEVRLVVFKLFDRHVVSETKRTYEELNQLLVRNGVLPEVSVDPSRTPGERPRHGFEPGRAGAEGADPVDPGAVDTRDAPGTQAADPSGREILETLRRALSLEPPGGPGAGAPSGEQARLVSGLTQLQRGDLGAFPTAGLSLDGTLLASGTANVLRDLKSAGMAASVDHVDQLMIDVVAMMFDYILDDENIPPEMKALIGRLQIPVLKVAILDKSVFARKSHPAKQLLNRLSEAALGWSERFDRDHAFYEKIESFVLRLIEEFDDSVDIFSAVLADLDGFLETESSGAQENAWWSTKIAQGRERLATARVRARQEVQARVDDEEMGEFVEDFLDRHWRELLVVRYVKDGEDSESWRRALQTLDDLAWSATPKGTQKDRRRLLRLLPGLIDRLKAGMEELGVAAEERRRLLSGLARLHLRVVRPESPIVPANGPQGKQSGGLAGGEIATAPAGLAPDDDETEHEARELAEIRGAIEQANHAVHETAETRIQCRGMGTTVVVARFGHDRITVGHVGDSRLYRLRGRRFEQLTKDHSLRQELIDNEHYTPEEATRKAGNNVVTRAVGSDPHVCADVQQIYTLPEDLFLVCSDGLTDMVEDERIHEALESGREDLESATVRLIEAANEDGGRDNISVALIKVLEPFPDAGAETGNLAGKLTMYGGCDVGRRRSHNEDSLAYSAQEGVVVLADGMGGCNAGEVASAMAVNVIMDRLSPTRAPGAAPAPAEAAVATIAREESTHGSGANLAAINALFWEDGWGDTEAADAGGLSAPSPDMMSELEQLASLVADGTQDLEVEEITLEGGASSRSGNESSPDFLAAVEGLKVGTWVEFRQEDGRASRARLTWISSATGRYLFTDPKGLKVADATRHGLAVELRRGTATIMDDVPLFDRAISHLSSQLHAH